MSMWDAQRAASKDKTAPIPICRRCTRPTVLDVCRACASDLELGRTVSGVPVYPALPDHYAELYAADPRVLRSIESS